MSTCHARLLHRRNVIFALIVVIVIIIVVVIVVVWESNFVELCNFEEPIGTWLRLTEV
jgi:hypothetical protein